MALAEMGAGVAKRHGSNPSVGIGGDRLPCGSFAWDSLLIDLQANERT